MSLKIFSNTDKDKYYRNYQKYYIIIKFNLADYTYNIYTFV